MRLVALPLLCCVSFGRSGARPRRPQARADAYAGAGCRGADVAIARSDLRRRHRPAHRRRHAELLGARGARRLADASAGERQARARMRAARRWRCCAERLAITDDLPADEADGDVYDDALAAGGAALPGAPRPRGDRQRRAEDAGRAQRAGGQAAAPARGLARPARRDGFHLRPALRRGEPAGRVRRGGRRRQGRAPPRGAWSASRTGRRRRSRPTSPPSTSIRPGRCRSAS